MSYITLGADRENDRLKAHVGTGIALLYTELTPSEKNPDKKIANRNVIHATSSKIGFDTDCTRATVREQALISLRDSASAFRPCCASGSKPLLEPIPQAHNSPLSESATDFPPKKLEHLVLTVTCNQFFETGLQTSCTRATRKMCNHFEVGAQSYSHAHF